MEALQQIVPLVIVGSLALLVFTIGLDATLEEILHMTRRPVALAKAVFAVNVVVPVAAMLIVAVLPISQVSKAALILMAVSPVPPLVPGNQLKTGARKEYAYGVYVALIVLAVIIVPATVALIGRIYGVDLAIAPVKIAMNVAITVIAPLALGLLVSHIWPKFAVRAGPPLKAVAMGLAILALALLVIAVWPVMAELAGDGTILAIVLMVLAGLVGGHLLGGPDFQDRAALAVTAATRHPGIALMIAGANFNDKRVSAAIIMVLLIGVLASLPYKLWVKRQGKAAGPGAATPVAHR